jgi:hypothetical protein
LQQVVQTVLKETQSSGLEMHATRWNSSESNQTFGWWKTVWMMKNSIGKNSWQSPKSIQMGCWESEIFSHAHNTHERTGNNAHEHNTHGHNAHGHNTHGHSPSGHNTHERIGYNTHMNTIHTGTMYTDITYTGTTYTNTIHMDSAHGHNHAQWVNSIKVPSHTPKEFMVLTTSTCCIRFRGVAISSPPVWRSWEHNSTGCVESPQPEIDFNPGLTARQDYPA